MQSPITKLVSAIEDFDLASFKIEVESMLQAKDCEMNPGDVMRAYLHGFMGYQIKNAQQKAFFDEALNYLVNQDAFKRYPYDWSMLAGAMAHGLEVNLGYVHSDHSHSMFEKLKDSFSGFTLNAPWGDDGVTFFMISAASYADEDFCLDKWIELGADPNIQSKKFGRALHMVHVHDVLLIKKLEFLLALDVNPSEELSFDDFELDVYVHKSEENLEHYNSLLDKYTANLSPKVNHVHEAVSVINNFLATQSLANVISTRVTRGSL